MDKSTEKTTEKNMDATMEAAMKIDRSVAMIDKLKKMVIEGQSFPLQQSKVVLSRAELLELLDQLEGNVTEEMKAFREVTDKRAKILSDAKKKADQIIFEAEKSSSRIRVTKRRDGEPLNYSPSEMSAEERKALRTAGDIYAASLIYTDEMLTEVDHLLADAYDKLEQEYKLMQIMLKEKMDAITDNKTELLHSLNSLSKEDRYAQIVELSQLLSMELYREKEKQKAIEKEKQTQMEIRFDSDLTTVNSGVEQPKEDRTPVMLDPSPNPMTEREPINPDRTPVRTDRPKTPIRPPKMSE
ncbi:MAG: hypothetical protein K5897_04225 [Eubacterium sp.]|nr:hypothetical protein [Eubacterium sp.]